MTIKKITVAVGSRAQALAAAQYVLAFESSPAAFVREEEAATEEGAAAARRANTMWLGSDEALGKFGLKRGAEVMDEVSALVLQGRHVVTGAQVRWPGSRLAVAPDGQPRLDEAGKQYRELVVNSYDLPFSAPKSVSVLWSQADVALRGEIERAMMVAANAMLEHVVRTRPVVGGEEYGRGFVAATALQVTARRAQGEKAPAPQLHVHCQLMGVLDAKGDIRAPENGALYKHSAMREAGAVGRAVLASELEKLGFAIQARTGRSGRYFEVRGVSRRLCERFSGRSRDVEQWVREREARVGGRLSNQERAVAAMLTREADELDLSAAEIRAWWDERAAEVGWGPEQVQAARALGAEVVRDPVALRGLMREVIIERLWEEGPSISVGALRAMAFELAPMGLSLKDANDVLVEMQRDGELITLDKWRVTSREIRAREEYVQKIAVRAAQHNIGGLSAEAVEAGMAVAEANLKGHKLDKKEQIPAIRKLCSGVGWACLTGRAGTGKGPVLEAVAEAHRADGWKVIGCAVDGATSVRLGHQMSADPLSIDMLLARVEHGTWVAPGRVQHGDLVIDERTLLVIEEASKVGLRHWAELAKLCAKTKMRVIAVGDVGQIGAIECPGMLDIMLDNDDLIPAARMDTVRRHRDPNDRTKTHPWLEKYQRAMYAYKGEQAIKFLRDNDAIHMHQTRDDAMVEMVKMWAARRVEHDIAVEKTMLIVHGSNDDVDMVNALAQHARRQAGELGTESVQAPDRSYRLYEGDVVMVRGAAYQPAPDIESGREPPRVENGTVGFIDRVDEASGRVWVTFDEPGREPRQVMIDLLEMAAQLTGREDTDEYGQEQGQEAQRSSVLRLAYAWHPFPAQGANRDYVGSLWGHFSQQNQETYSGDTRAVCWLDVHTDVESMGTDGDDDERYKRWAKRLSKRVHRRASITYKETPDVELTVGIQPGEPVPQFRERTEQIWAEIAETPDELEAMRVEDPLEAYRDLLGPERYAQIAALADAYTDEMHHHDDAQYEFGEEPDDPDPDLERDTPGSELDDLGELDDDALIALRDQGQSRLEYLDPLIALEAVRLESDQPVLAAELDRALQQGAPEHVLDQHERALRTAINREIELHTAGEHPEQWLQAHGQAFAMGVAAQRTLALRQQIRIRDHTNQALREPPDYILALIGPAPRHNAKHRQEWEHLTRRLVRDQLMRDNDLATEPEPDDDLQSRIAALRTRQGLQPLPEPEAPTIEQAPSELDIGF